MLRQELQERRLLHTEQMRVFQSGDGGGARFRIERGKFTEHLSFPQKAQLFHPVAIAAPGIQQGLDPEITEQRRNLIAKSGGSYQS